jgi:hypothetical protein
MAEQNWPGENNPGGGGGSGTDPQTPTYGPFNATTWEKLWSVDHYGLPELNCYYTTVSGGQSGIAFEMTGKWKVFRLSSRTRALQFANAMKNAYNPAAFIGL